MSVVAESSSVNRFQEEVLCQRPIPSNMRRITTMILCGGQGTRLFPLTQTRCKPAMCYGGRYRLIDFPLSNAINSGCRHIFLLTQFLSNSLHKHVFTTYRPGVGSNATIDILSSEERPGGKTWFRGTADAVRQTIEYTAETPGDYILVLSGDQIYTMDFHGLMQTALDTNADAVVAALPVTAQEAPRMGILQVDEENAIINFCEKPQTKQQLVPFTLSSAQSASHNIAQASGKTYLGSMGIYLFKKQALLDLLKEDPRDDFGKHLIPSKVSQGGIFAHIHQGYWEDIGTIESFYSTNIALTQARPPFNPHDESWPLYAQTAPLPGAKLGNTQVNHAILCEGVQAYAKEITHSILGPRTVVHEGSVIRNTYVMGHDVDDAIQTERYSIGRDTLIDKAIIDKQVTIGSNVRLTNEKDLKTYDSDIAYIRDGIIVIPRGTTIPNGYTL